MDYAKQNEENISQRPAIDVLVKLGYQQMSPAEALHQRRNLNQVLLHDVLKSQLERLNRFEYKGMHYPFSQRSIKQAMYDLDEGLIDGLVKTNEKIYDMLLLGRSYQEELEDGTKRSFDLNFIDWEQPSNNVFHVVEEFTVERLDGQGTFRPDIVLFVNGIPFGVIECKKASISMEQGIRQTLRNQEKGHIPQLFKFVQLLMSTNKNHTKYGTVGTPLKFWSDWREEDTHWLDEQLAIVVKGRLATKQDRDIISIFHPERLLELTTFFTVFDHHVKKIARYQQFFAIRAVLHTIDLLDEHGNRTSGTIWHTQGSGKSLTMVMLAKFLLIKLGSGHPKLIVVTDRVELDKQIQQTFAHTRLKATRATTGRNLVELINSNSVDIITTLVHKFDTAAELKISVNDKDIFVLVDESHRTQYGELHLKMRKLFPNACYLGFTGTPLMKKQKNTMAKFGALIHTYNIADGVRDGAIVPLLYEGKMVEQTVNRKAIDNRLEMITVHLNDKQKDEVMKKWSRMERIFSSDQRLQLIAFDINQHYMQNIQGQVPPQKAMLATNSRIDAIRYYRAFESMGDLQTAVVMSPPDQREGSDEIDSDSKDIVQTFWQQMMERYSTAENYEESIKDQFKHGDLDLIIVVDKLLTGFDAPPATVLYNDKDMKEHTLLQAIARVNRLYDGKDYGFVIDYRGLLDELNEAMEMYGKPLEQFQQTDLAGAVYDVLKIVGDLRQSHSQLVDMFFSVQNRQDHEEFEVLLGAETLRETFYRTLAQFSSNLQIALSSLRIYTSLGEQELDRFKADLKFWQELRRTVKLRYSDSVSMGEFEMKMQKLMDQYIAAEEVIRITNPIDILNKEQFDEELARMGSDRAKADMIRTRMAKRIHEKMDEDPVYYKKFSERIEEALKQYKERRISEAEYLKKMSEIMADMRKGNSGVTYPEAIQRMPHAQAFYGVVVAELNQNAEYDETFKDIFAQFSMEVEQIIRTHTKVDWHENQDVHKKIEQHIDDLIYAFEKKHQLTVPHEKAERLIENLKKVALRRF